MATALALNDSEVASVTAAGSGIAVRFSAASLRRTDAAPGPSAIGFGRGVVMQVHAAQVVEEERPLLGRLAQGRIRVAGRWLPELVLPFDHEGPVQLELAFANRSVLVVRGAGVSAGFDGEPNFTESLAC